jgi:glycosyltransferase involved in cell wall biosynthesis
MFKSGRNTIMQKISIVVPVYNVEEYLTRCVNSIRNQTFKDIEIILVDDGSEDASGILCDKFADEDSRVNAIHTEHLGPIQARHIGLQNARADYVTFVDSDDWIEPDTYEILQQYLRDDVDVVKFLGIMDFKWKKSITYQNTYETGYYDRRDLEEKIFPTLLWDDEKERPGGSSALWDKVFKKSILLKSYEKTQNLHFHFCEDSAIVIPMYRWVNSMVITEHVFYHHCHEVDEVSSYIKCDDFFDNLYKWHIHLRENVKFLPNYKYQLEKDYINAMKCRLLIYNKEPEHIKFLFPFAKVKCGSNIIIWGYGNVGRTYEEQIKRSGYCNIVCIVDKNYEKYNNANVLAPEQIIKKSRDYIVIAIEDKDIQNDIIEQLKGWGGILEDEIVV